MTSVLRFFILLAVSSGALVVHAKESIALRIQCEADATDAHITINGKYMGQCPMDVHVPAGNIELSAIKKEGEFYERRFDTKFFLASGGRRVPVELGPSVLNAQGRQKQEQEKALENAKRANEEAIKRAQQDELKRQLQVVTRDYTRDSNKHLIFKTQIPAECVDQSHPRESSIIMSPDAKLVAFATCIPNSKFYLSTKIWEIWSIEGRNRLASLSADFNTGFGKPFFTSDSRHLVLSSRRYVKKDSQHDLWIWAASNPSSFTNLSSHSPFFNSGNSSWEAAASSSPSGRYVAAFTEAQVVTVWDTESKLKLVRKISAPAFHENVGDQRKLFINDDGNVYLLSSSVWLPSNNVLYLSKLSDSAFKDVVALGELGSFDFTYENGRAFAVQTGLNGGNLVVIDPNSGEQLFLHRVKRDGLLPPIARINGGMFPTGIRVHEGYREFRSLIIEGGAPKLVPLHKNVTCNEQSYFFEVIHHFWKDRLYCLGSKQIRQVKVGENGQLNHSLVLQLSPDLLKGRRSFANHLVFNDPAKPIALSFRRDEFASEGDKIPRLVAFEVWGLQGTELYHAQ